MKKVFLILVLCCMPVVIAEEIKLNVNSVQEETINLNPINKEKIMQTSEQDLKQGPIILQNNIAPVSGLQYKSDRIIEDSAPQPNDDIREEFKGE